MGILGNSIAGYFTRIGLQFKLLPMHSLRRKLIPYICGLGASVGYERVSEHSTRRDESHKWGGLCFDGSSVRQFALNTKLSTSSVLLKHFVVIYQM